MHCWNRNRFFPVPAQLRSALKTHAPYGCHKDEEGCRRFCEPILVVLVYFSRYFFRDSGTGRRLRVILWNIAVSEMMVAITSAVLNAVY